MLISSLKPEEYALALSKLQSLGLPIISNKAPLCSMTGVMGLNIPMDEVNHTTKVLKGAWQARAIHIANNGDFTVITLDALITYLKHKGVILNPMHTSLSMVVPSTWLLLLNDMAAAEAICTLCHVILLGKELDISPWKDGYTQGSNQVYIQGLAEITSCHAVMEFLRHRCVPVTDHFFSQLINGRMALWMTIQFKLATGMNKALELNGRKSFNRKAIAIIKSKMVEE
ncbi:uncharacterized protein ACA1_354350 [Acanthamoeba castellanii str. Neff]|uniref:Uncharacterized protein n=1 Tax=Acanthamoeba castellanii (strain ATCC 30010 / Neff) TaxID=1257118 RepID=L8GD62_ACACF|nr:uncharacterized protein ACA1_354350 [Acanthamoeba castellanii str. Neff]ELR10997.1 hypothetical protein ACA1_354350 [Acanthamoeba castellanii str. Neff]